MAGSILLQGGTLLLHDDKNHIVPTVSDLLVAGQFITKIGKDIKPEADTEVIDCRGKIVSPGFIDTHRHLWQSQYKGCHANNTLVEYMPRGNFSSSFWSPEDLFWGQLAGALESIDAGTTTIVDHSSCNGTGPEHSQAAIQAVLTAGVREVYCWTPARTIVSTDPWKIEDDLFSESNFANYRALALEAPYGGGRVHVGYAWDNVYLPGETLRPYFADLRDPAKGRAKVITTHTAGGTGPLQDAGQTSIQILHGHGLLGPDVLISHSNWPREGEDGDGDGAILRETGAFVSSTPNTELQMGRSPVALRPDHYDHASLGVDCHSWGVAGLPGQMRMLLQWARADRGDKLTAQRKHSRHTGYDPEQVFNLGTLGGAKAAGLQDEVGSLKEGLKADILVFDGSSPSMIAAAQEHPVAAVVMHSNPSDIELVLVDGVVRKEGGKLVDVTVAEAPDAAKSLVEPGTRLAWKDVARKLLESREPLMKKLAAVDMVQGENYCMNAYYFNKQNLLEADSV